jgi:spoIIIJ-associated protein
MPIDNLQEAAQKIAGFLATLNKLGGMRLKYRISAPDDGAPTTPARRPRRAGARPLRRARRARRAPGHQHNGELLLALETIATQILRLDQREVDLVSFDAANFKALRAQELRLTPRPPRKRSASPAFPTPSRP